MTTTPSRRIDEIGEESRRRILDAAEELFSEKGFEKTSFVDISARSGISRGSIPWHFKNKDGLLIAVVERANQRYLSLDQFSEKPSLREVLDKFELLARDTRSRLMFTTLNEAMSTASDVRDDYRALHGEQRARVAHWLKVMGVRSPQTRGALATAIVGSIIGITLQWQIDQDNVDLGAAFDALADLVESHLP